MKVVLWYHKRNQVINLLEIFYTFCSYHEKNGLDSRALKERLAELEAEEEAAKAEYELKEKELSTHYVKQWNNNYFVLYTIRYWWYAYLDFHAYKYLFLCIAIILRIANIEISFRYC